MGSHSAPCICRSGHCCRSSSHLRSTSSRACRVQHPWSIVGNFDATSFQHFSTLQSRDTKPPSLFAVPVPPIETPSRAFPLRLTSHPPPSPPLSRGWPVAATLGQQHHPRCFDRTRWWQLFGQKPGGRRDASPYFLLPPWDTPPMSSLSGYVVPTQRSPQTRH